MRFNFLSIRQMFESKQCRATAEYGLNEYDAHLHRCPLDKGHDEYHDFSVCPEKRRTGF